MARRLSIGLVGNIIASRLSYIGFIYSFLINICDILTVICHVGYMFFQETMILNIVRNITWGEGG
jgi:hypothetical protein